VFRIADLYKVLHDNAVLRLAHAGAVPNNTVAMIAEWFRDWKSPLADLARKIFVPSNQVGWVLPIDS
jgi:hypothetical protein